MGASKRANPSPLITLNWPAQLSGYSVVEVGLSGGLDSVVLLDLLSVARDTRDLELSAVYVHHGLSANADAWAEHCRRLCATQNIPLRIERVAVDPHGDGIESAARRARYAVYRHSRAQAVALAQHLDDQAETLLLQALRGGGPHALAAMPVWRPLTDRVALWRPLLAHTRDQLAAYAAAKGLSWVDDESNADPRYRRNWLRHQINPLLAAHLPDYRQGLLRCAAQMADAAAMLDELVAEDLAHSVKTGHLQLDALQQLSPPRQRQLLLRWAEQAGLGTPTPNSVEDFRCQLLQAQADRQPKWTLPQGTAHRYRRELWADPHQDYPLPEVSLSNTETLTLPDWGGALSWLRAPYGISDDMLMRGLTLRLPPPGASLMTAAGHKALKQLFQEAGIPPFLRRRWPGLYNVGGTLTALPSVTIDATLHVAGGWQPLWTPVTTL